MQIREKLKDFCNSLTNQIKNFKIETFLSKLNRSQQWYFWGLILVLLGALPTIVCSYSVVLIIGLIFLACGIISDFLFVAHKVLETLLGKALLVILASFITTLGYAFASQIINEIVQFDTSAINYATSFTAVLLIPLLILLAPLLIMSPLFMLSPIIFIVYLDKDLLKKFGFNIILEKNFPNITMVLRAVIYTTFFGFITSFLSNPIPQKSYEKFVINNTKTFIYTFEAKQYSRCANIPASTKVITVPDNNDEIILVTKVGKDYSFKATQCLTKINKSK